MLVFPRGPAYTLLTSWRWNHEESLNWLLPRKGVLHVEQASHLSHWHLRAGQHSQERATRLWALEGRLRGLPRGGRRDSCHAGPVARRFLGRPADRPARRLADRTRWRCPSF